jgi:hypothetical protein
MARIMKMVSVSMLLLSMGLPAACSGGNAGGAFEGKGKSWEVEYRYQIQGEKGQETVVLRFKGADPNAVGSVKYRLKEGNKVLSERDVVLEEGGKSVSTFYSQNLSKPDGKLAVEVEWDRMKETVALKPADSQ